jgi:hypothetical protein
LETMLWRMRLLPEGRRTGSLRVRVIAADGWDRATPRREQLADHDMGRILQVVLAG